MRIWLRQEENAPFFYNMLLIELDERSHIAIDGLGQLDVREYSPRHLKKLSFWISVSTRRR